MLAASKAPACALKAGPEGRGRGSYSPLSPWLRGEGRSVEEGAGHTVLPQAAGGLL